MKTLVLKPAYHYFETNLISGKLYKLLELPHLLQAGPLSKHQGDLPVKFRDSFESVPNIRLTFNQPFVFIKNQSGTRPDDFPEYPKVEYIQILFKGKLLVFGADNYQFVMRHSKIVRVT